MKPSATFHQPSTRPPSRAPHTPRASRPRPSYPTRNKTWGASQPELDPDPDWDIKPHQQHEPDTEWDFDWNADWDNDFNPSTPSVEHLWDPEPSALEIIEPEIPAGWTLLDTPDPWQPISTGNAVSDKAVRGP